MCLSPDLPVFIYHQAVYNPHLQVPDSSSAPKTGTIWALPTCPVFHLIRVQFLKVIRLRLVPGPLHMLSLMSGIHTVHLALPRTLTYVSFISSCQLKLPSVPCAPPSGHSQLCFPVLPITPPSQMCSYHGHYHPAVGGLLASRSSQTVLELFTGSLCSALTCTQHPAQALTHRRCSVNVG